MNVGPARILVAGVGNIFLGDDAFGVEVLRHLAQRPARPEVRLVDFGIRGIDLVYELLKGYDLTILVDATKRGGAPGTLYTLEPEISSEAHGMDPTSVFALAAAMGVEPGGLLVVGCEPSPLPPDVELFGVPAGLSDPVARAIEPAAARVESLIQAWLRERMPLVGASA
jgi:hydrogenase maturation protease